MDAHSRQLLYHLPYLRRYARALTADAVRGDDLVAEALPIALADPGTFGLETPSRLKLYGLLNGLCDADAPQPADLGGRHPMEMALAGLPELERRLFLLVSLEELTVSEAGSVLGLDMAGAEAAMTRAQTGLGSALTARIMIVEDDAIIAFDLEETVQRMGHIVCGTAANTQMALTTAAEQQPTLALMDLRLAGGDSGITTAQILRRQSALPIIFVTAFGDELSRRGLDHLGPVIRKPFSRNDIERAITQAVFTPSGEFRSNTLTKAAAKSP
ncbi:MULTISPECIES: PhyR family response regulator anti-anti-sigma factor [unclassified Azospirillum]|jgi:DNA-directed RNA polymerase specialized sigma24 family protein/ActR/RegA family two-component response regulator|uniref:PhyR family response regulator anti-anti-sigma factor n=1 Tax=unclassified Azospirillum TaxID=2630922 RepID=UPI000B6CA39B|nr:MULTISPECIES: response regulator [unclassified Azospirillum]SNR97887.1 Response regulator receiver domain-containing protein [Azospirillum sp. RU38E]SNS15036.1 Response regulator receiver domain-containing protein [Azospirillum sp. RU37A]